MLLSQESDIRDIPQDTLVGFSKSRADDNADSPEGGKDQEAEDSDSEDEFISMYSLEQNKHSSRDEDLKPSSFGMYSFLQKELGSRQNLKCGTHS